MLPRILHVNRINKLTWLYQLVNLSQMVNTLLAYQWQFYFNNKFKMVVYYLNFPLLRPKIRFLLQ